MDSKANGIKAGLKVFGFIKRIATKAKKEKQKVSLLVVLITALPTIIGDVNAIIKVAESLTPEQKSEFYTALHNVVSTIENTLKSVKL